MLIRHIYVCCGNIYCLAIKLCVRLCGFRIVAGSIAVVREGLAYWRSFLCCNLLYWLNRGSSVVVSCVLVLAVGNWYYCVLAFGL